MKIQSTGFRFWFTLCWLALIFPLFWIVGCGNDNGESPQTITKPVSGNDSGDSENTVPQEPPEIFGVVVAEVKREGVVFQWKTDNPATSQVEYGETPDYGRKSRLDSRLVTAHEVVLTDLKFSTEYHFRVLSRTSEGQPPTVSEDGTFTAAAPSFSKDILPLFQVSCMLGVRCHAEVVGLSDLKLTGYDSMMKGGVSGPPIVPGDANASLLVKRITGQKLPQMPLDNRPLKPEQIDVIIKWIEAGAKND